MYKNNNLYHVFILMLYISIYIYMYIHIKFSKFINFFNIKYILLLLLVI